MTTLAKPMSQERPISDNLKRQLYRQMLLLRKVEERIVAEYPKREMRSPPHFYIGQEAVAVGVCAALRQDDLLFPYYRSHGWYLAKGGNLNTMIAELFGRENGCSRGWGGSMHLIDLEAGVMGTSAIVAGTISHAAGAALALKMQGKESIATTCFGDGAVEEGVFHETLNFAALRKLPVVFVCENNLYAVNTHIRDRQAQTEIYRYADSYGIPSRVLEGNDVVETYQAMAEAVQRARRGEGPTLIEYKTYRHLEHCGINEDYDLGYRTPEEGDRWKAKDPLILNRSLVSQAELEQMNQEIEAAVDEAFDRARSSPFPASLFTQTSSPVPSH